ncbi:MAG: primosomal protein N' [Fibrobacterales bacterium]
MKSEPINPVTTPLFSHFAEIAIPGGLPEALTYGISDKDFPKLSRGSVVHIELRNSTKLGVLLSIHTHTPNFEVKECTAHSSHYIFPSEYMELLEKTALNNLTSINKTLQVFWPAAIDKYLNKMSLQNSPDSTLSDGTLDLTTEKLQLPPLTTEQQSVVERLGAIVQKQEYSCNLIKGVTGSGKSRVYMELAQKVLNLGKNILILVPEISLTPQTFRVFSEFFSEPIDLIHSNLGDKQKRESWLRILRGESRIVMGTRSATLTPLTNIGLIIIDEEHDGSFKQQDPSPRYHARDIVLYRAHNEQFPVILGSATPALESYHNASKGHYSLFEINQRVHKQELPKVTIVDMKKQRYLQGDKVLSIPLREALVDSIAKGEQVIILHNRRGYHTSRLCSECGTTHSCQDCDIPLIYHKKTNTMLCHYCSRCYPTQTPCACGNTEFIYAGSAIEKAEEEIASWVPEAKIIRMDRDTTARKGASEKILNSFRAGEYNILLGTQMVAKGHDFPNVEMVAILSADSGLNIPDFRTSERMFQLITQVSGRAGRSSGAGRVILQTYNPDDRVIQYAISQDYVQFASSELSERGGLNYPPFSKIAGIEITGKQAKEVRDAANKLCSLLKAGATQIKAQVLGPVEASVAVVKRQYRLKILIKAPALNQLRWLITSAITQSNIAAQRSVSVKVDIDPQNTL